MNTLPALNPVVRVWDTPLSGAEPAYIYEPQVGLQMRQIIPIDCRRAVLIVNGQPMLQRFWHREIYVGDVIEWHIIPSGKGASRTILTIVAMIAIAYFTAGLGLSAGWSAVINVGLNLAAQLLINALIPIKPADNLNSSGVSAGSVYNTSLSGNQARLNQPIPVLYGRNKTFPDFACQPYQVFRGNDQYYYTLMCIGEGHFAIEAILIDDTPIANFQSVFYKVLAPGVAPTQVEANMVTSIEVAGNELVALKPVGGFVVNRPRTQIDRLYWDVTASQGLGLTDGSTGAMTTLSVAYTIDIQYVDDFGVPLGGWQKLIDTTFSAASRTPQRTSDAKDLPTPGRVSVRVTRTTAVNTSNLVSDTIELAGLRGRLTSAAPLASTATHLEIVMRANEQLNSLTQKKLGVISRRLIKTWDPIGGWSALQESRSIAWAIVDKLKDTTYGDRLTDDGIDLQTFYNLDLTYAARQDRLDIVFDSRVASRDANRTMAQVGRAIVFQRMGVFTMTRDQFQALPAAAYTTRDIIPGSTAIGYSLSVPETPDAISYEYFDNRSWDWVPILCKVPGVVTPVNTMTLRVSGITGAMQALREGTYLAAQSLYRRKFPKWQTEMKGLLVAYGSAVIFSPALPGWGSPGDVVAWDYPTLRAMLSEEPVWTPGKNHFITLERPSGSLTIAIPVLPGASPNEVILGLDPGFQPITLDSDSDRTKYVFGPEGQHQVIVRLMGIQNKGKSQEGNPIIEMSGVAENNLVHTADNAYLPAGGVIQDPVPTTTVSDVTAPLDAAPGANPNDSHIRFIGESLTTGNNGTPDSTYAGGAFALKLNTAGTASLQIFDDYHKYLADTPASTDTLASQWFNGTPDVGVTSQYEANVFLESYDGTGGVWTGPSTWAPLSADHRWIWAVGNGDRSNLHIERGADLLQIYGSVRVQIRRIGATSNLIDTTMAWGVNFF